MRFPPGELTCFTNSSAWLLSGNTAQIPALRVLARANMASLGHSAISSVPSFRATPNRRPTAVSGPNCNFVLLLVEAALFCTLLLSMSYLNGVPGSKGPVDVHCVGGVSSKLSGQSPILTGLTIIYSPAWCVLKDAMF